LAFNLDPNFTEAYLPLGIALAREGRWSEAAQVWHRGLAKNPGNHTLRGYLAQAFYEHKELNRARREYGILQGQGWTQSTAEGFWEKVLGPDPAKVDPASALELATQLCQASGWSNPRWLDLLAVAQAALDQFDKAQETVRQALAVASEPELVGLLEEHLILFAENQKVTVRP
jgi:tetratricopeptide (TPR) repeat protein